MSNENILFKNPFPIQPELFIDYVCIHTIKILSCVSKLWNQQFQPFVRDYQKVSKNKCQHGRTLRLAIWFDILELRQYEKIEKMETIIGVTSISDASHLSDMDRELDSTILKEYFSNIPYLFLDNSSYEYRYSYFMLLACRHGLLDQYQFTINKLKSQIIGHIYQKVFLSRLLIEASNSKCELLVQKIYDD